MKTRTVSIRFLTCRFVALLIALFVVSTTSGTLAAGVDGTYRVSRLSNSVSVDGQAIDLPLGEVLGAIIGREIVIEGKRVQLNPNVGSDIDALIQANPTLAAAIQSFEIHSIPRFNRFRRAGNGSYQAKTTVPLEIEMTVSLRGVTAHVTLRVDYRGTLKGNKLKLKAPLRGDARVSSRNYSISGNLSIWASRN